MRKTVRNVKNSLKFKAQPKGGLLSVRIGVKKYTLPINARILTDSKYVFLSFPACSELFKIEEKEFQAMPPDADATEAYMALNPSKRKAHKRKTSGANIPTELVEALRNLPAGYKIGYDLDGSPRLVRKRQRGG